MGTSRRVALLATVVFALGAPRAVRADIKGDIQAKIKEAMESYDLMDYDAAKKLLNQAVATAKRAKLDKDPVTARAYLDLGIVAFAIPDQEAAKVSFLSAVKIDPKIQIDAAYRSAEMAKLLDEMRGQAKGGGEVATNTGTGGGEDSAPSADCGGVKGLQHEIIDTAKGGTPLKVEALVGSDVKGAAKVSIMYRAKGASEFTEIKMTAMGCKYSGAIPASALKGDMLHYYVAAYDKSGKVIVGKGSQGAPNLVDVTGGGGGGARTATDDEDPLGKGGGSKKKDAPKPKETAQADPGDAPPGGEVDKGGEKPSGPKHERFIFGLAVGTGFEFAGAGGFTEGNQSVKNAGFTNSLLVVTPEFAYAISPKLAIGIAARLGFPIGANVDGHATLGPSVLARLHVGVAPGVTVIGQVGYGVVRGTIQLDNAMAGMNTDVVAEGPVLIGAGLAYKKGIGGPMSFVANVSALGALSIGCTKNMDGTCSYSGFGSSPAINGGFVADVGVGLQAGF